MFDFLRSYDYPGVDHRFFAIFLKYFRPFVNQAFHCLTGFTLWLLANLFENFFQTFHMRLRLFEMFLERVF